MLPRLARDGAVFGGNIERTAGAFWEGRRLLKIYQRRTRLNREDAWTTRSRRPAPLTTPQFSFA